MVWIILLIVSGRVEFTMGISGLLPRLQSITTEINIKSFKGKILAVDGYVWLHRGSYACSAELCQNIPTDKYVPFFRVFCFVLYFFAFCFLFVFLTTSNLPLCRYISYFLNMVGLLTHNGITPLIVFDGNRLPAKSLQEEERHKYGPKEINPFFLKNNAAKY